MSFSRGEWAKQKSKIALALGNGECGGGYGEAILILCATISAMAAEAWPGRFNDRKRFIEIVVRFSKTSELPTTISVPLLLQKTEAENRKQDSAALKKAFLNFPYARILLGQEVDHSEKEILQVCPKLSLKKMRDHSYANLLYTLIRSPYSHQYFPDEDASPFPMTMDTSAGVSYANRLDAANPSKGYRHLICFHLPWLAELAINLGQEVDAATLSFPLKPPKRWWADG